MASILSSVSYFSSLPPEDLRAVEESAVRASYQPGQIVLMEGDAEGGLYVVESGWLKAVRMAVSGREQVVNLLGRGDVFNGVAVFTDAPNQASVIALEESRVWRIGRATMRRLIDSHPQIARAVIVDLAGRMQHLLALVEDLSLRTVESRLARALLESQVNTVVRRRKWATQSEMAARLGTVPDVLNRALRRLADEGLIEVDRREIRILDPQGLSQRIESE